MPGQDPAIGDWVEVSDNPPPKTIGGEWSGVDVECYLPSECGAIITARAIAWHLGYLTIAEAVQPDYQAQYDLIALRIEADGAKQEGWCKDKLPTTAGQWNAIKDAFNQAVIAYLWP